MFDELDECEMNLPEAGGEKGVDDEVEAVLGRAHTVEDSQHHLLEVEPEDGPGRGHGEGVEDTVGETGQTEAEDPDDDDLSLPLLRQLPGKEKVFQILFSVNLHGFSQL